MEFESTKAADGLGQAAGANASLAGPGTESEASRHQHTPDIAIAQQTAHVGDAGAAAASAPVAIVEPANPAGPTVISRLQETAQGSVDARQERLDIQVQAGQTLFFDGIDLSSARIQDLEGGILITLADGTVIFLAGFVGAAQSSNPPVVQASGGQPSAADGPQFSGAIDTDFRVITISASDLLAAARGAPLNLQPAAGPAVVGGAGARFATVDSGDDGIGEGLGRSGLLGADPSNPPAADESIRPAAFQGAGDGTGGSDSATVEVTVDAVNDAPVAADDDASTDEDSAVDISVLANDGDADGDPLTVTAVTQGANGTVVDNGDGTLTYTPDADFNGTDSFTYTISDGNGGSDSATVEVTVNAVNDDPENESPVAEDDTVLTPVDTAAVISVLTNDSDADLDPLSVVAAAQGSYGTVVNTGDGTVTYTPDAGFSGIDSFTYTVGDGNGGSDSAAVVVYVGTADAEGTSGDDVLVGGNSDDVIFGHGGNDDIHGGNGNGTDILFGGDGNDVIDGGNRDDQLFGGAGADTLIGGSGADTLDGGSGADVLNGGSGADMLNGGAGADMLNGGSGADTLNGGLGDDILVWDASDAAIDGGSGLDTLRVDGGNVDVTAFGGTIQGIDRIDLQSDAGANGVTLSAADVLSMSDGGSLTIDGDAGDSVDAGSGWTDGGIADGYHTYTQGAATLLVDTDVSVNPDILA